MEEMSVWTQENGSAKLSWTHELQVARAPRPLATTSPPEHRASSAWFALFGELKLISQELILELEWFIPLLCPGSPLQLSIPLEDPFTIPKTAELRVG
ncbi:hypothetical protein AV530_020092 [Patagioenas fasciata monilis]|uniref:Uncharacterized protein n=1 Tax=Patagioenas fasciata monilis TaxID=372326 RepID=A0A1V4JIB4_PATFA|nr:hypothetical protein AV530_020092 [Patagioenas fasciata monilis]